MRGALHGMILEIIIIVRGALSEGVNLAIQKSLQRKGKFFIPLPRQNLVFKNSALCLRHIRNISLPSLRGRHIFRAVSFRVEFSY